MGRIIRTSNIESFPYVLNFLMKNVANSVASDSSEFEEGRTGILDLWSKLSITLNSFFWSPALSLISEE